jgi:hypothetical protein
LESVRGARDFLDANAARLPGIADGFQRQKLDGIIVELEGFVGAQAGNALKATGATRKHATMRRELLRDHMAPIAKIAAAEPQIPELEALTMPAGNMSIERLRQAAIGMAKAAEQYADVFIKSSLPADFINELLAAADAMVAPVGARKQSRASRAGATKGLTAALSAARKTVHALDALIKRALKDDTALVAAWRTASRVEKAPVTPVEVPPVTTPQAVPPQKAA